MCFLLAKTRIDVVVTYWYCCCRYFIAGIAVTGFLVAIYTDIAAVFVACVVVANGSVVAVAAVSVDGGDIAGEICCCCCCCVCAFDRELVKQKEALTKPLELFNLRRS